MNRPSEKEQPSHGFGASNRSVYEIRTLRDIFELPTFEQMETCLNEIASSMKMARATADMVAAMVELKTGKAPGKVCEWPEKVEWKDDGKGELGATFKAGDETVLEVTSRHNDQSGASAGSDTEKN